MFCFKHVLRPGLLGLCWLLAGLCAATAKPVATAVRTGEHVGKTRFVLDLSEPADFRVFLLSNPYRVVIDLPEIDWHVPAVVRRRVGLIRDLRYGLFSAGVSRVVLDVTAPVEVQRTFLLPPEGIHPYRFVVDIGRVDEETFAKAARLMAPPAPARPPGPVVRPRGRAGGKRVVAIDPGHGGVDPGTTGTSGIFEKHVTLAVARELERTLRASGRYRVVLTRGRDVFVRLRQRVAKAREGGAELLISLHADSIDNRRLRGASIYTLHPNASDKEAEMLAAKENKADIIAGVNLNSMDDVVTDILIDLSQGKAKEDAVDFANLLLPEMAKAGKLLRTSRREAGFAVLTAPDVPSVLIEMGYLSNRQDEKLLTSPAQRKKLASAIARAIDKYFASHKD